MLENWGQMTKAQDDAQKINEAIDDAISTHNDDPTAHLGDGRSLEAHKINEVIDHPAGSVLADKMTAVEMVWQDFFTNANIYNMFGDYNFFGGGGVDIYKDGVSGISELTGAPYDGNITIDSSSDFTSQYTVQFGRDGSTSRFLLGVSEEIANTLNAIPSKGCYFEIINNSMRGKVRLGGVTYQTNSWTPPNWKFMILRIFYDHVENSVSFFVNGSLLGKITLTSSLGIISFPIMARVETTDTINLYNMSLIAISFTRYYLPLF